MAVRVVVPPARVPVLVPHQHHGCALAHHKRQVEVFHLTPTQVLDGVVHALALAAVVPRVVVVAPVAILLAVGVVVFVVVRHQVSQREPVVRGYEVEAVVRLAPVHVVHVRAAAQAARQLRLESHVALDEPPQDVAVLPVPLPPPVPVGEAPYLVQTAAVPRLGEQFRPRQRLVFGDLANHRRPSKGLAVLPARHRAG